MGREDRGGGKIGAAEETVDRRAGSTGGWFGLDERWADDDEEPVLELEEGVSSVRRREITDGSVRISESNSFIWLSSRREPSLIIGVEIIDKEPTQSYGGG